MKIRVTPAVEGKHDVWIDDTWIGLIFQTTDKRMVFEADRNRMHFHPWLLRAIADQLDAMNAIVPPASAVPTMQQADRHG